MKTLPHKVLDRPRIETETGQGQREFVGETDVVPDNDGNMGCCDRQAKCTDVIVHCNEYDTDPQSRELRDNVVAADFSQGTEKESSVPVSSIPRGSEGHRDGESISENGSENVAITAHATPNTAVNCFQTTTGNTSHTVNAKHETPDDRAITPEKLKAKISAYEDLNEIQRDQLLAVLMKFQPHLTKRPGNFNGFEYHFKICFFNLLFRCAQQVKKSKYFCEVVGM